jgi:diguanylate cyclase (GGDEF)-like protein
MGGFFSKDSRFNSFLDYHDNIMIISSNEEVKYINKAGLSFFGFNSLRDFKSDHKHSINTLFIEDKGSTNQYTLGKNWLSKIVDEKSDTKKSTIKVKLYSKYDGLNQYFYIKVKQLKRNEFLLSFCNINDIEIEKNNLRKQADYDLLTQVYNRVKFNEVFTSAINRAMQLSEKFSLILFDIDHFKRINDTLGHNVGDRVLFELARMVNMEIREIDIFARWGGEEFIIVAKHVNKQKAGKIASSLRKHIESYNFGDSLFITCSFGVTEFEGNDSEISIFKRVDSALYEAKDHGRNRVVVK